MKQSKVALYVRCSTADQKTDLQLRELGEYVKQKGWTIYETYEDKATGTNTKRPMFQKMMADARAGHFDTLICWKLDRMARSLRDLILTLQELSELGVTFVSVKDQLDLGSSAGRLMLHIIGAFGEFEASIIRERVRAGVRAKIAKTGRWGPKRTRDDSAVSKLRSEGFSVRQIAKRLGISPSSVARSLKGVPGTLAKTST